jgi:hypothetical protein
MYRDYDDLEDYAINFHDSARVISRELNNEFGKEIMAMADKLINMVKEEKYGSSRISQ